MSKEARMSDPPQPPGHPGWLSRPEFTVLTWGSNHDLVWASKVMPIGANFIFQDIQLNGYAGVPFVGTDIFVMINGHNGPDCTSLYGITSDGHLKIGFPRLEQARGRRTVVSQTIPSNEVLIYNPDEPGDTGRRYVWINDDWHAPKINGAPELGQLVTLMALRANGGPVQVIRDGA